MITRRFSPLALALLVAAPAPVRAEEPAERLPGSEALKLVLGFGQVLADGPGDVRVEGSASGISGGAEYVLRPSSWFSPRLYGGLLLSSPRQDCGVGVHPCEVSGNYLSAGGKVRLQIPIPWVAPFVEFGFGLSVGRFSTRVGSLLAVDRVGFAYHWPFAFGLAIGSRRQYELAYFFFDFPRERQFGGGILLGYQFDLD